MEALLQHQQFGPLGFHHPRDGYPGPSAHHFGNFIRADFLTEQPAASRCALFAAIAWIGGLALFDFLRVDWVKFFSLATSSS